MQKAKLLAQVRKVLPVLFVGVLACTVNAQEPATSFEERIAAWLATTPTTPLRASVGFDRFVPDAEVATLLTRHNTKPVAVYMYANGLWATHRISSSKASSERVAEARRIVTEMMQTGL